MSSQINYANENYPVTSNGWSLILLEAWRRGLGVSIHASGFTISSTQTTMPFRLSRLATPEMANATKICNNKHRTKEYFLEAGVNTPKGRIFKQPFDLDDARGFANSIGFPVCLKANSWSKGKGVFSKIDDKEQFDYYLDVLTNQMSCREFIVEQHFGGDDFRFYVTGQRVPAVTRRIPANVVGDGENSIATLIENKNELRMLNPYLKGALIHVDAEIREVLGQQDLSLDSVPDEGKLIFLRRKSNASAGGDTIDVTDHISEEMKDIAISAVKSIPGLAHGGVDMIIDDTLNGQATGSVIEINAAAELGIHLYPLAGESRFVPTDIIDLYFPQSNAPSAERKNWFFDLQSIMHSLKSKVADTVTPPPCPEIEKFVFRRIQVSGEVQRVGFRKNVSLIAREYDIHGTVNNNKDGTVTIMAAGRPDIIEKFVQEIKNRPGNAKIEDVAVHEESPHPITVGFRVK